MGSPDEQSMWAARPGISRFLRVLARAVPIAVGVAVAFAAARLWLRPPELFPQAMWWVTVLALSGIAMYLTERFTRRLLPLSALFSLTLAFPDQAPSRFRSALRTGNTRTALAQRDVLEAKDGEIDGRDQVAYVVALLTELTNHDRLTRGHVERVRAYCQLIGEEMGLNDSDLNKLQFSALLHDAGKLDVPADILAKPSSLTGEEYAIVKEHPSDGERWVAPLRPWLGDWLDATAQHHERFDGSGYPLGLTGKQLSPASRIVAVADAYDVITAARSYKPAESAATARHELTSNAGTQFDPVVVRAFLNASVGQPARVGAWAWALNIPLLSMFASPAAATVVAGAVVVGTTAGAVGLAEITEVPQAVSREVVAESASDFDFPDLAFTATSTLAGAETQTPETLVPGPAATGPVAASATTVPDLASGFPTLPEATLPEETLPEETKPDKTKPDKTLPDKTKPDKTKPEETLPDKTLPPRAPGPKLDLNLPFPSSTTMAPIFPGPTTTAPATTTTTTTAPTTTTPPVTTPPVTTPPVTTPPVTTIAPCDLANALATDGSLAGCDLSGADLSGVDLSGLDLAFADLSGADLSGADLTEADLFRVNLVGADLSDADLSDVDLFRADLTGANLTGAVLDDAELSRAVLVDAVLIDADLTGAEVWRTDLTGADLTGANIEDVEWDQTTCPNGVVGQCA